MFKKGDKVYFKDRNGVHKTHIGTVKMLVRDFKYTTKSVSLPTITVEWEQVGNNRQADKLIAEYSAKSLIIASATEKDNPNFTFAEEKRKRGN